MSQERFEELLPWYVNGTASESDRAWVDGWLSQHPESRAELDWYQSLQRHVQDGAPAIPATLGLARTMKLIQGDRPSFAERVAGFFAGFGMKPGLALAGLAVFAIQGGVILNLMQSQDEASEIRSMRGTVVEEGPLLKVSFAPDARESDIRLLLVKVQGELAGGPGQLGDYYLRVPAGTESAALAAVQSAPIVQAAALAPGVPPRE